jgi:sec-independent protein translocase protein TatA
MFGLGHWELLIILLIIMMVFGAGKLPGVMRELGNGVKSFKDSMSGVADKDDPAKPQVAEAPKPAKAPAPKKAAAKTTAKPKAKTAPKAKVKAKPKATKKA